MLNSSIRTQLYMICCRCGRVRLQTTISAACLLSALLTAAGAAATAAVLVPVQVGILSTLRHPNVVLFMGVCLSPPAVVTEYCPLRSLYDVLKKV